MMKGMSERKEEFRRGRRKGGSRTTLLTAPENSPARERNTMGGTIWKDAASRRFSTT
jgi:hypothetical protein